MSVFSYVPDPCGERWDENVHGATIVYECSRPKGHGGDCVANWVEPKSAESPYVPDRDAEAINKLAERLTAISRRELDDRTITPGEAAALVALVSRNAELERTYEFDVNIPIAELREELARAEARVAVLVSAQDELQRKADWFEKSFATAHSMLEVAEAELRTLRAALSQDVPAATILPLGSAFVPQSDPKDATPGEPA